MPSLPDRPNLEQLKNLAKSLLRAAHARDDKALGRFAVLPAFAGTPPATLRADDLALHDAQSVIAREHGFLSWRDLREDVEARALSFEAAVDEFLRLAAGGVAERAEKLLALHPRIAAASIYAAIVLGDASSVAARLAAAPGLATAVGGPLEWEPLLYACHTSMHRTVPERAQGLVPIARQLCALGANPNAEYHWNWHPELPRTAIWGALCAVHHLPLAEVLLEAGANPTDGVSAHIAGGSGDIAALELLGRHGLDANGIQGGVPPLVYMMTWCTNPDGPRWLLAHGADSNRSWGEDAEAPLHVAARRWDAAMADLLLRHGADPDRRRADGQTPLTIAQLCGNDAVAARLEQAGSRNELSPVERLVAACSRGDRPAAETILAASPSLTRELRPEHHLLLHRHAESGNVAALETMAACGFDVNVRDKDQVTPVHRAAMAGWSAAVGALIAAGADLAALDGMFAAPPLVWAVEGRGHAGPGADHVEVARLLIAAGSPLEWTPPDGAPQVERTLEGLAELRRAALAPA